MNPLGYLLVVLPLVAIAGLAILWVHGWMRSRDSSIASSASEQVVAVVGWMTVLVGLFGFVGIVGAVLFPVVWFVTAIVLLSLLFRHRASERRSLLWMLMVAAERGIPLEAAARAFAEERRDALGARVLDLAEYLEAGLPLAVALKRAGIAFPPDIILAAELGQQTGRLGEALRQTMTQTEESENVLQSAAERLFYLVCLLVFGGGIWTFLTLKIVAALEKILKDFQQPMPDVLRWMIGVGTVLTVYWPVTLLGAVVLIAIVVRALSYYTGYSPRYLPGMSPLWGGIDRSVVMRWLAVAVRQNRPMPDMLRLLTGYLTRIRLRRRLQQAARRIDQGAEWSDCLERYGLIRRFEGAVLRAAERAGNLEWAMQEMAQGSVRRSAYRLRAVINVAFPAALLLMGGAVLMVALAVLIPLFHLIQVAL